jgi:hypothetical protein
MKPKTGFESGTSPTFSPSGAPLQTGRGLEATKQRLKEAFERVRQQPPDQPVPGRSTSSQQPLPPPPRVYTEKCATQFQERAERLTKTALTSAYIFKTSRTNIHEIAVPTENADELIRQATRRRDEE